jgi:hypothetical protein
MSENESESELVWGAKAIGIVINRKPRPTYYMLETGRLPATKVGDQWVGKRSELRNPACWPRKAGDTAGREQ